MTDQLINASTHQLINVGAFLVCVASGAGLTWLLHRIARRSTQGLPRCERPGCHHPAWGIYAECDESGTTVQHVCVEHFWEAVEGGEI